MSKKKYVIMFIESEWHALNIDDFNDYHKSYIFNNTDTLFTFQSSDLIREFKVKRFKHLPTIIDIECLDKQMSQEGKEFRSYKKWSVIQFLTHYKIIDQSFKLTSKNFKILMENLASLILVLMNKDKNEQNRFEKLELKINKIIYERQLKGVGINIEIAKERCNEIEKRI